MREMMMVKQRWRLKIMSGPGDTRGRGVLGHDRGLLILNCSDTCATDYGTGVLPMLELGYDRVSPCCSSEHLILVLLYFGTTDTRVRA